MAVQFGGIIATMLDTLRKTESSLRRLRRDKPSGDGGDDGAAAVSDIEKITMQLFLDVKVCSVLIPGLLRSRVSGVLLVYTEPGE